VAAIIPHQCIWRFKPRTDCLPRGFPAWTATVTSAVSLSPRVCTPLPCRSPVGRPSAAPPHRLRPGGRGVAVTSEGVESRGLQPRYRGHGSGRGNRSRDPGDPNPGPVQPGHPAGCQSRLQFVSDSGLALQNIAGRLTAEMGSAPLGLRSTPCPRTRTRPRCWTAAPPPTPVRRPLLPPPPPAQRKANPLQRVLPNRRMIMCVFFEENSSPVYSV